MYILSHSCLTCKLLNSYQSQCAYKFLNKHVLKRKWDEMKNNSIFQEDKLLTVSLNMFIETQQIFISKN